MYSTVVFTVVFWVIELTEDCRFRPGKKKKKKRVLIVVRSRPKCQWQRPDPAVGARLRLHTGVTTYDRSRIEPPDPPWDLPAAWANVGCVGTEPE